MICCSPRAFRATEAKNSFDSMESSMCFGSWVCQGRSAVSTRVLRAPNVLCLCSARMRHLLPSKRPASLAFCTCDVRTGYTRRHGHTRDLGDADCGNTLGDMHGRSTLSRGQCTRLGLLSLLAVVCGGGSLFETGGAVVAATDMMQTASPGKTSTRPVCRERKKAGGKEEGKSSPEDSCTLQRLEQTQQRIWRSFVSGFITGTASRAIKALMLVPLDTIKVRQQQVQEIAEPTPLVLASSTPPAAFFSGSALADLYRGWIPALLLAGPSTAVFFAVNDLVLASFSDAGGGGGSAAGGWWLIPAAATAASVSAWGVRTPFEVVKVALQGRKYENSVAAVKGLGVTGLWSRLPDFLVMYLPGDPVKMWVYGELGGMWRSLHAGSILLWQESLDGAIAYSIVTLLSNPVSVVNTRLILKGGGGGNVASGLKELIEAEGLGALAYGLWPRLIKGAVSGAVTFTIYELSKTLLSKS